MDRLRVETLPDPSTPTTPSTPSGFSAIFGHEPSNRFFFGIPSHKEDEPPTYEVACQSPSFLIKLLQLFMSIVTAGLYSAGILLIEHDITTQQMPFVVTSAYIIITAIIILSYVLGHKMPEILIRMFNLLAVILFAVTGIVLINYWIQLLEKWREIKQWQDKALLTTGIFCLINSCLYGLDFFLSIKRTLNIIAK